MPDCHYGVVKYHSGATEAHYGAHLFTHTGVVTVDGAFAAGAFVVPKFAGIKTHAGIHQQLGAIFTQWLAVVVLMQFAVEADHCLYCLFFILYSCHLREDRFVLKWERKGTFFAILVCSFCLFLQ